MNDGGVAKSAVFDRAFGGLVARGQVSMARDDYATYKERTPLRVQLPDERTLDKKTTAKVLLTDLQYGTFFFFFPPPPLCRGIPTPRQGNCRGLILVPNPCRLLMAETYRRERKERAEAKRDMDRPDYEAYKAANPFKIVLPGDDGTSIKPRH